MTRRKRIIEELKGALQQILIANGYVTDAGLNVYLDMSQLDETGEYPAININEALDSNQSGLHLDRAKINLPISVEAFNKCTPANANDLGHDLIGDIKQALFSHVKAEPANYEKMTYVSANIAQRENGTGLVSVNVLVDVIYQEYLPQPED